jgi:GT2 family glycosyltransferase
MAGDGEGVEGGACAVHVVIPTHNRAEALLKCLEALAAQTYSPLRIVVVDDGSTDGTADSVRAGFPDVEILKGDGNLWWTGAIQLGVDHVLKNARASDFVLSMNSDTAFDSGYVSALVRASIAHGRALTGSFCRKEGAGDNLIDQGGRFDWAGGRHRGTIQIIEEMLDGACPFRTTNAGRAVDECLDRLRVVDNLDFLFGRGTLIPVEVFGETGGFRVDVLPHYGSDVEFTARAAKRGFSLILSLEARMVNLEAEGSTGVHYSSSWFMPYRQALKVLTSRRSAYQLEKGFRFTELCCPPEYRRRNKWRYLCTALRMSLWRTFPAKLFCEGGKLAATFIRRFKYLFVPVPMTDVELKSTGADVGRLVRDGVLKRVRFRGSVYFRLLGGAARLAAHPEGARVMPLYRSLGRLSAKLRRLLTLGRPRRPKGCEA